MSSRFITLVIALCATVSTSATSYLPVTFNDLVTKADLIFIGEVTDVRPYPLQTREGTIVKTRVVFRVWDPIYGTASTLESLDFLGGEWDGIDMAVAEMPTFAIGDRRVVFARRDQSINPIVGFTQGLLRITADTGGIDRVFTLDNVPLASPESIGTPLRAIAPAAPMPLSQLRDRVVRALIEARKQ